MNVPGSPLVVVSIVNWNTAAATLRCLRSVFASGYPQLRVVVVDNASQDDSVARIAAAHPDVTLLQSDSNLGFAAGHALAWRQAMEWNADAIWLLNSDVEIDADALQQLVDAWREHGDAIYGAAPLSAQADGVMTLNFSPRYLDPAGRPRAFQREDALTFDDDWRRRAPMRVGAVAGSCLFLPLAIARAHGWMGAEWFLYCEEVDYCYRLQDAGVSCYLVSRARVLHRGGGSHRIWAGVGDRVHYYRTRNEIVLARRHAGIATAALIAAKKILRGVYEGLRRPRRGIKVWQGVCDALLGRMGRTHAPEAGLVPTSLRHEVRRAIAPLRMAWQRSALRQEQLGALHIAWNPQHPAFIRAYYLYCVALFRTALIAAAQPVNVIFGDYSVRFHHRQRTLRVDIQHEHTLVRPGGRDSARALPGSVPVEGSDERYLVRIERLDHLQQLDAIIDYSGPNLAHIAASRHFDEYLEKCVHIAPLLHPFEPDGGERMPGIITLFGDTTQTRRAAFLQQAIAARLPLRNVSGVFEPEALRQLYRRTRVLVNVHQTDHHHSFEELRVLPALLCGVVVVSEDVPLKEHIPYARFIIWARHEDLIETAQAVHRDYAQHQRALFGDPDLPAVLQAMEQRNHDAVERAVRRLLQVPNDGR